jgi:transcriptional regulator with XRE-family HTH domain
MGVSPPTLLRVESGRIPDVGTFGKICKWLEVDPGMFLGVKQPESHDPLIAVSAHFRADQTPEADTISALSQMLVQVAKAQRKFRNSDPDEHP